MRIPGNAPAQPAGILDGAERARAYLQHETGAHFDARRIDAFLEAGPRTIAFFEQQTALQRMKHKGPERALVLPG